MEVSTGRNKLPEAKYRICETTILMFYFLRKKLSSQTYIFRIYID